MRLHHLEVTAFGPFTETVAVDFDALAESGLFLLAGPTGAGKTSVLDAVCFALYGEVPGDRNAAKRLRSDRAAPDAVPRVRLEVTLVGRRFRFVRSPAWARPKKRGSGTTPQPASVSVAERRDGAWHPLSSRLDETGHLVGHLLGMNLAQFCQVAMLPQGRFQAFLRARSDERQRLLQQLFRTSRFEDMETWLRDHRQDQRRRETARRQELADAVARVSEAAARPLPDACASSDLAASALDGSLAAWARECAASAVETAAGAARARADASHHAQSAEQAAIEARHLDAILRRRREAEADLLALEARAEEVARMRSRLHDARRAVGLAPLLHVAEGAARDHAVASATAGRHRLAVAASLGVAGPAAVTAAALDLAVDRARVERARLAAALTRESELADLHDELTRVRVQLTNACQDQERLRAEEATAEQEVAAAQAEEEEAASAPARLDQARARLETRQAQAAGHRDVATLSVALSSAERRQLEARTQVTGHKETWLRVREARIAGMAAELAGRLAVGDACPVCGSADHPLLAVAGSDVPDARSERAARRLVDDAEVTLHACDVQVHDLRTRLALAVQAAGPDPPEAVTREVAEVSRLVAELGSVVAGLDTARSVLDAARARREHVRTGLVAAGTRAAELRSAEVAIVGRLEPMAREIARLLADHDAAGVTEAVTALDRRIAALASARAAVEADERARETADRAAATLEEAAAEQGFPDAVAAATALLADDEEQGLEQRVAEHRARLVAARGVLFEPEVRAAASTGPADVSGTESALDRARRRLSEAEATHALAAARADRLTALDADVDAALGAWAPAHADLAVVSALSAFVDGRSADNRLQMRLSAYVLAARLGQVVSAANERLAGMSDQRYSLLHTGHRGAGETRGGLSLAVRDDWSGETRDPATLSGGETFVVSLALALGLADVTAQEAGGADLDTLFVDEGFGSLDPDTLDDVMDTLDSLRDGGRVVGVVSHVPEMRERIPTRLEVDKHRRGSTVRLVHAG